MARRSLGRPLLALAALVLGCGGILLLRRSEPGQGRLRLVELVGEARLEAERGEYALFDDQRRLRRDVALSGESLESITPPFPSRLVFELRIPSSPTLELATALITMQDVSRARVRFSVVIETREESATVFEQVRTREDANRWEGTSIDLSRFAGQDALLVLVASPVPEREGVLWANRVLTAWGDPVIDDSTGLPSAAADVESWLRARLPRLDGLSVEDALWTEFAFNSLLAGLLSLCLPLVHRLGSERYGARLPNGLTLFTLTATLIVAAVHSSVALSLGLLGSVSIFRFRAPIPSGEHLLSLLLCIAIALPLGVNRPLLGVAVVSTSLLVAVATRLTARSALRGFLLTASGKLGTGSGASIAETFASLSDSVDVESLELGRGHFAMSARMNLEGSRQTVAALSGIRGLVDDLRISLRAVDEKGSGR
ncbi:MAG: hypothetical protein ACRD21_02760 [Vicinamibacteria bacterium]